MRVALITTTARPTRGRRKSVLRHIADATLDDGPDNVRILADKPAPHRSPRRVNDQRHAALTAWLERYNYDRKHTTIGAPPASRVNNVPGRYT
jgi:hypothetical protein